MRKLRPVFLALWSLLAPAAFSAPLELKVVGPDGRALAGTVVVLRSTDASRPLARPVETQMDQVNRQFVPHVLVVPAGSRVSFPNSDSVSHQVYSFSPAKKFDLPLYRGKAPDPVLFDQAGVVVLGCNIHDNMRAYVFVVEAQYFGRTDAGGLLKSDVQPGNYVVQVWHPLSRDLRPIIEQQIAAPAVSQQILRVASPLRLRPESQVPANWDAY